MCRQLSSEAGALNSVTTVHGEGRNTTRLAEAKFARSSCCRGIEEACLFADRQSARPLGTAVLTLSFLSPFECIPPGSQEGYAGSNPHKRREKRSEDQNRDDHGDNLAGVLCDRGAGGGHSPLKPEASK